MIKEFLEGIQRHMAYIGGAWLFLGLLRLASIYRCPRCDCRLLDCEGSCPSCSLGIDWKN